MRKFLLLLTSLLWMMYPLVAQKFISGKVVGQSTSQKIPFANIGILNSPVGTISNQDGSFSISIPAKFENDTLQFSSLGYELRKVPISSINPNKTHSIFLPEKITTLETVTVSSKKEKDKNFWLGNKHTYGKLLYADSVAAGSAMALLIRNKYPSYHEELTFPVWIKQAKLKIFFNTFEEFKVRIRFLEVDSLTKLPGKDIFHENLVVTSTIKKGWLKIDLTPYNLKIAQSSFFLVFEWILEDKDRLELINRYRQFRIANPEKFSIDTVEVGDEEIYLHSYKNLREGTAFAVSFNEFVTDQFESYTRLNSFGEWQPSPAILTARVLVTSAPDGYPNLAKGKSLANETNCENSDVICRTEKICNEFLEDHNVNGIQLTVSKDGKNLLSKGFGYLDRNETSEVTSVSQFRIGSVSKSLTSGAIIKLIAEKKLDLDAPVQKYVPSFPEKKYPITTRQLAGHLAGIRHYSTESVEKEFQEVYGQVHYKNSTEAISIFKNDTLLFEPGTKYQYSSYGWNLIGAVIEGASHQNYLDYMQKNIWQPLGMESTYGDIADSLMPNKSRFYFLTGEEAGSRDLSFSYPAGGLVSTTDDLVKFGNELLYGNYFDAATKEIVFKTQYTSDQKPTNYGIGWHILKDKNGHPIWVHSGSLLEGSAYLLLYPEDNLVVAFLANSREGLEFDIQKIGELFY